MWFRSVCTQYKPPVLTLVNRGTDQRHIVPAKSADKLTV